MELVNLYGKNKSPVHNPRDKTFMTRKVRLGDKPYISDDNTVGALFPGMTYRFRIAEEQILDVKHYCYDQVDVPLEGSDLEFTNRLRRVSDKLSLVFDMPRLTQKPMYSMEDGPALLLPLDNSLDCDYLTYHDPRWKEFVTDLVDDLLHDANDEEVDTIKTLLVDYSVCVPYASILRHDGRQAVSTKEWSRERIAAFSEKFGEILLKNFETANIEDCCPPINASKSAGFNTLWPDGSRYLKSESYFCPVDCVNTKHPLPNTLLRYSSEPLKRAWVNSGALQTNLDWFLNEYNHRDFSSFLEGFSRQAIPIHVEAYRGNNADPPLNEFVHTSKEIFGKGYKKDRVVSYEYAERGDTNHPRFFSGVIRDAEWSSDYSDLTKDRFNMVALKKRPMFPANNASFMPPFIAFFRFLFKRLEDSPTGFPSLRPCVLERYQRFLDTNHNVVCFISMDRKNSEQFITDNWDKVISLFPKSIRDIVDKLGTCVIPSHLGPRVVCGALASGSSTTTAGNVIVGVFELTNLLQFITKEDYNVILDRVVQQFSGGDDFLEIGAWRFCVNLGTDDWILPISLEGAKDCEQIMKNLPDLNHFFSNRSLSGEVSTNATVFGLHFTPDRIGESKVLGIGKFPLMEKERNGDRAALKMFCRFRNLSSDYVEKIQRAFTNHGFGSISTYQAGAKHAMEDIEKFGFSADVLDLNAYSPSDQVALGSYFSDLGVDPTHAMTKYSSDVVRNWYDTFADFINKRR